MQEKTALTLQRKAIQRCGSWKRPICYTLSNKSRDDGFLDPKNDNRTIDGKLLHHPQMLQNKKLTVPKFSVKKHVLPDSKRTLIPEFAPEIVHKPLHRANSEVSNKFNSDSLSENLLPKQDPIQINKRKTAERIMSETTENEFKRQLASNDYHKLYVLNSQINTLPGPNDMKRNEEEFYLSKNLLNKNEFNSTISRERKVLQDYNSNVSCLPGCTINNQEKQKSLVRNNNKRNESHIVLGIQNEENINKKPMIKKSCFSYYQGNRAYYENSKESCDRRKNNRENNKENICKSINDNNINNNKDKENISKNNMYFKMSNFNNSNVNNINNNRCYNQKCNTFNSRFNNTTKYYINKNRSQIIFG